MASDFTPTWLDPADVLQWLQANGQGDVVGIERV